MKYLLKTLLILLIGILIIMQNNIAYGAKVQGTDGAGGAGQGYMLDTSITSSKFTKDMNPDNGKIGSIDRPFINTIVAVINPLLRVAQIVGGLLMIVSIAIYGISMLLATESFFGDIVKVRLGANNLLELKKIAKFILIGSILLFFSTTIVRVVFRILNI